MVKAVRTAVDAGAETVGVNAEDGSRTDDAFLAEFGLAAKEAGAARLRYCDTIGGDTPWRIRDRFARLAATVGLPVETHCHNDLGLAVANSISGARGGLDAGQDAWINTCVNGIGERAGNADLLSCVLALRYGFGASASDHVEIGDSLDLAWGRRFALWASYAFDQPLPANQVGVGANAFAHESGIHADGALKDHRNYELYDDAELGPFPADWHARSGRVVLTGEYGGTAGFRHVMEGLGVEVTDEELTFRLVQLSNAATGRPLTDDELHLIAAYPNELALLYPGHL
jgi:homocitrate synthase NifV